MLFTTPSQWAMLVLCVVAGWLFGLAMRGSGARARDRLRDLETQHAAYRHDMEARLKAVEAERDRVVRAAPITAQMVADR